MRSLPSDKLSALIFDSILNSDSLYFLDVVNLKKDRVNLLVAPSQKDKIILINAIGLCLFNLGFNNTESRCTITRILDVYNTSLFKYFEFDNINFYDVFKSSGNALDLNTLSFLTPKYISMIDNWLKTKSDMPEFYLKLFKVQMFIYASVWFDMDKYLKYLYYLYK